MTKTTIPSSQHKRRMVSALEKHERDTKHSNKRRGAIRGQNSLKRQFSSRLTRLKFWERNDYLLGLQSLLKSLKTNPSRIDIEGYIRDIERLCRMGVNPKFCTCVGVGGIMKGLLTEDTVESYLVMSITFLCACSVKYTESLAKKHLRYLFAAYLILQALEESWASDTRSRV